MLNYISVHYFSCCSNVDQIREFVKNVYVEKKFLVGIKSSEKLSIDIDVWSISSPHSSLWFLCDFNDV